MATEDDPKCPTLAMLVMALATLPLDGYAVKTLWWWFVVPLGAHGLTVIHATALSFTVKYIVAGRNLSKTKDYTWSEVIAATVLAPLIGLGLGWLLKAVG